MPWEKQLRVSAIVRSQNASDVWTLSDWFLSINMHSAINRRIQLMLDFPFLAATSGSYVMNRFISHFPYRNTKNVHLPVFIGQSNRRIERKHEFIFLCFSLFDRRSFCRNKWRMESNCPLRSFVFCHAFHEKGWTIESNRVFFFDRRSLCRNELLLICICSLCSPTWMPSRRF